VTSILAISALICTSSIARADEAATEIIKKAVAAHGGEDKLKKIIGIKESTKGTGKVNEIEFEFTGENLVAPPSKLKAMLKLEIMGQNVTFEQIIDGDKFKAIANGAAQDTDDKVKEDAMQQLLMREAVRLTPLLADKGYEIKAGDTIKIDDNEAQGVIVSSKKMQDIKLYFDKKTNLLVKVERKGIMPGSTDAATQVMIFGEYKDFGGVKRHTKVTMLFDNKKFLDMTVTDQKFLEKVDDKDFAD
jgi:hypothetical protein